MTRNYPAARITLLASLIALALVPAASAAKGKSGGGTTSGGSYSITVSPAGPYAYGETIYTSTNAPQVAQSYIALTCSQNGVNVLGGTHANWSGGWYYNWPWVLDWGVGGPATCTVTVFVQGTKTVTEASTSFSVSG
jgi:hypothetical protein